MKSPGLGPETFTPFAPFQIQACFHLQHLLRTCFHILLINSRMLLLSLQKVDPELIFTKQERIGKGSFGEVFKGVDNRTQQVRTSPSLLLMVHGVINYTSSCPITPPPSIVRNDALFLCCNLSRLSRTASTKKKKSTASSQTT